MLVTQGFGVGAIVTQGFGAGGVKPGPIVVTAEFNRLRSLLKNRASGRICITGYYEDWRCKRDERTEDLSVKEKKLNLNSLDAAAAINTFEVIKSDVTIIKRKEKYGVKSKKEQLVRAKGKAQNRKQQNQIVQGSAKLIPKNTNIVIGCSVLTPLSKSAIVFGEAKLVSKSDIVVTGESAITSLIKTRIVTGKSTVKPVKTTKKRKKRRRKIAKTNE